MSLLSDSSPINNKTFFYNKLFVVLVWCVDHPPSCTSLSHGEFYAVVFRAFLSFTLRWYGAVRIKAMEGIPFSKGRIFASFVGAKDTFSIGVAIYREL